MQRLKWILKKNPDPGLRRPLHEDVDGASRLQDITAILDSVGAAPDSGGARLPLSSET